MSKIDEEFPGHLITFETKNEEEIIDENVLVQLTQFRQDGTVEIAFNDRNERCYLQFRLQDLMEHVARQNGEKTS